MKDTNQVECLRFKNPQPQTQVVNVPNCLLGLTVCAREALFPGLGGQLALWAYSNSSKEGEEESYRSEC